MEREKKRMTSQLDLFNYNEDLTTEENEILLRLKVYNVGRKNAIPNVALAQDFNMNSRKIREIVKSLRSKQDVTIASCNQGYYIPTDREKNEASLGMLAHAMTAMDTVVDLNPANIKKLYKHLNQKLKTLDGAVQNQVRYDFDREDYEIVKHYKEM